VSVQEVTAFARHEDERTEDDEEREVFA